MLIYRQLCRVCVCAFDVQCFFDTARALLMRLVCLWSHTDISSVELCKNCKNFGGKWSVETLDRVWVIRIRMTKYLRWTVMDPPPPNLPAISTWGALYLLSITLDNYIGLRRFIARICLWIPRADIAREKNTSFIFRVGGGGEKEELAGPSSAWI